jgi:Sodium/hydrogen exchanger family
MAIFEIVIALLLGGAVLAAIARRMTMPYPALVAIAGAALALFPNVPALVLDPELALVLFVAPVLLDAAFDASQRDLRRNWRAVTSLAVGAVVLTVTSSPSSRGCSSPDSDGPRRLHSAPSSRPPTRRRPQRCSSNSARRTG